AFRQTSWHSGEFRCRSSTMFVMRPSAESGEATRLRLGPSCCSLLRLETLFKKRGVSVAACAIGPDTGSRCLKMPLHTSSAMTCAGRTIVAAGAAFQGALHRDLARTTHAWGDWNPAFSEYRFHSTRHDEPAENDTALP